MYELIDVVTDLCINGRDGGGLVNKRTCGRADKQANEQMNGWTNELFMGTRVHASYYMIYNGYCRISPLASRFSNCKSSLCAVHTNVFITPRVWILFFLLKRKEKQGKLLVQNQILPCLQRQTLMQQQQLKIEWRSV